MELVAAYVNDRQLRRERRFRDQLDPLNVSDNDLLRYYRFPRQEILRLIEELEPILGRATKRCHAIPTHTQLLVALRFFASGSFQSVIGDATGLTQASVSRIIRDVTTVLYEKARLEIKMPQNVQELTRTVQGFFEKSGFPRVCGVIDGTHVPIKKPINNEYVYINRKNFHSINVQAICNSDKIITSFCARYPGSTHDSFIWGQCPLRERFVAGAFRQTFLLGDSGYPLEPYLLIPYASPDTPGEERYNRRHTRTRTLIEHTFGLLKSRFRCLHKSGGTLQYSPEKCAKITVACMLLHNYCIQRRIPLPIELLEDDGNIPNEQQQDRINNNGEIIRDEIVFNHFN